MHGYPPMKEVGTIRDVEFGIDVAGLGKVVGKIP
jgi:hypothetical protein